MPNQMEIFSLNKIALEEYSKRNKFAGTAHIMTKTQPMKIDYHFKTYGDRFISMEHHIKPKNFLCHQNGIYLTVDGKDAQILKKGDIITSANIDDCSRWSSINSTYSNNEYLLKGGLYRRVVSVRKIADNTYHFDTSEDLPLKSILSRAYIQLTAYQLDSDKLSKERATLKKDYVFPFNYDSSTDKAEQEINVPMYSNGGLSINANCKNCYAYLKIGYQITLELG